MRSAPLLLFLLLVSSCIYVCESAKASLVSQDGKGKLTYKANDQGDKIMDYSSAGYKSGSSLPSPSSIPVVITLKPSGGDDTSAIQNALKTAGGKELKNGFRGAVLLSAGSYKISKEISFSSSGVVLRGSGPSTVLHSEIANAISMSGSGKMKMEGKEHKMVKGYYPFGSSTFSMQSADGLKAGDSVAVKSTITKKFIAHLGMDKLVRNGKNETWIKAGAVIITDRIIKKIQGNNITLDAAFPDSIRPELFDSDSDVPTITKYTWAGRLENSGIENLAAVHPSKLNSNGFIKVNQAINCWVRELDLKDYQGGVVTTGDHTKFITVQNIRVVYTSNSNRPAPPAVLALQGTQILHIGSTIKGGNGFWPLSALGTGCRGPVVHHNITINSGSAVMAVPHMRWSTGILYDNVKNPSGTVEIIYRGIMGSGHGWTMGWGVIWNSVARELSVQNPFNHNDPSKKVLYHNWLVGSTGKNVPGPQVKSLSGTYDSPGSLVTSPSSLYLAQVQARKAN
eukprot:TRINITY_DN2074_c0_g1_i1.p1 TRINITY_DN2074_c0_g1~~TRINITY_DN2074_c0_g1_i1.p1  ORF type:complete len:510 (+),score=172.80 TRINITY_DN2074_c0_g1_i1:175-1704(+)